MLHAQEHVVCACTNRAVWGLSLLVISVPLGTSQVGQLATL